MGEPISIRRAVLAGALALCFTGAAADLERVQAMPVPGGLAQAAGDGVVTTVQYMRYPRYRYRRFNRHRRAGLYRCGPGALSTHLERKACRG